MYLVEVNVRCDECGQVYFLCAFEDLYISSADKKLINAAIERVEIEYRAIDGNNLHVCKSCKERIQ